MNSREINPQDVERLIREGKLRFGQELEFSGDHFYLDPYHLCFCDMIELENINGKTEIWFVGYHPKLKTYKEFAQARFPLPKLRDGDPVVCIDRGGKECFRHFESYLNNNEIYRYVDGLTKWTSGENPRSSWKNWRLPTLQELQDAGYSEEQIKDLQKRGCILNA